MSGVAFRSVPDLVITDQLYARPRRTRGVDADVQLFRRLSVQLVDEPAAAIQGMLEIALVLCGAGSGAVSVIEADDGQTVVRWKATAGELARYVGRTTPREGSHCGLCMDAGRTILISHPARAFDHLNAVNRPLVECLVVPLYDSTRLPFGAVWIAHHDIHQRFDSDDVQVLELLAGQLALALELMGNENLPLKPPRPS